MGLSGKAGIALLLAVLALAGLVVCVWMEISRADGAASKGLGVPLDDSWIHFVYAKSFGTSLRLDYNPGQSESGFTSLLWVILLAPGVAAGVWPALWAKILGYAALLGCAWLVFLIARTRGSTTVAFAAAFVVAVDPLMSYAAMSGMETVPYALAMLLAAYALVERKHRLLAGALAACAWARPDGVILIALVWLALAVERWPRKSAQASSGRGTGYALIVGVPLAAAAVWCAYNLAATGRPLSSSYYARAGGLPSAFSLTALAHLSSETAQTFPELGGLGSMALIAAGAVAAFRRAGAARMIPVVLLPPAMCVLMGGELMQVIGGTFPGNRYLIPIFPLLVLLGAESARWAGELVRDGVARRGGRAELAEPVVALLMIVALTGLPSTHIENIRSNAARFAAACRDLREMQEAMGRWIRDNTPEQSTVCTFDAGAIRYLGERETVDILGLNTARFPTQDPAEVKKRCQFLVTYPKFSEALIAKTAAREIHSIDVPAATASADRLMAAYDLRGVNHAD
ncbi:MAG: hypothetical protein M5R36_24825 [Deltaproteobacteria bacterium]|nr:hypothetical protein [Deltaproteobacteria bacterium]